MIVRSYVPRSEMAFLTQAQETQPRICGGWVATLPELIIDFGKSTVLPAAVRTLALSIASKQAQHTVKFATLWQSYGSTLGLLRQSLRHDHGTYNCEHLAAMMCLTLTELLVNTQTGDPRIHIDGLASMFRNLGPAFFAQGMPHKLFVGFRPLLVLQSIISRSQSFIAHESWKTIPFSYVSPSPMQKLLTEAVTIASVLEKFDLLSIQSSNEIQNYRSMLQDEFESVLQRLDSWKETYESKSPGPLYWPRTADVPRGEDVWLWFDSVVAANALTHYWAFTAICLVHSQRLNFADAARIVDKTTQTRKQYAEALSMICQSIPFLFEDSHALYGPSSVAFLLNTVVTVLKIDEELYGSKIAINQNLVDYAKARGFYWVS
ncbi:hypothetical protein G7054_g675 [Neopestalotiopsis clavispora]|nr:hypothetical protein G7054_g675 [Neopestalotiopsis clavispora]